MEQDRTLNQDHNTQRLSAFYETEPAPDAAAAQELKTGFGNKLRMGMRTEFGNVQIRLRILNFILQFCPTTSFCRFRTMLYRFCGVEIGPSSLLMGNLSLSGSGPIFKRLKIGRLCLINSPLHLDLNAPITIGNRVSIGHHVIFITTEHEIGPADHRCGAPVFRPITIGNGCWIGACVTILPGVTVGEGCVVSAGSVVSTAIPANKLVAGNPARPIKSLETDL